MADTVQRLDEGFLLALACCHAQLFVGVQNRFDHIGHFKRRERGTDHLAGRGRTGQVFAIRAAQRDLVPLLAVFVDTQDADVAGVVVACLLYTSDAADD